MTALPSTSPLVAVSLKSAILDLIRAEMGGLDPVEAVVLHQEGMEPEDPSGPTPMGVAILVADPGAWLDSWRIEDRLNRELADSGFLFELSLLNASEARRFRRCRNHFPARVLDTGIRLWPDRETEPTEALPYAEAIEGTAAQSERRAANWLIQPYQRPSSHGEACAFAYRAACEFVKIPLIRADAPVWLPAVRWRLERLLQMADWFAPALTAEMNRPVCTHALPPDYFVSGQEVERHGFPERTESEARAALVSAWRIGHRFAPEAIRLARQSLQPPTGTRTPKEGE